jgi:hypothetical protein
MKIIHMKEDDYETRTEIFLVALVSHSIEITG